MALNLKSEIDRLNNNKENTKKVAINIDNRLVALGGQRATDLADVPNKIQMLIMQYKKVVMISNKTLNWESDNSGRRVVTIPLNLDFTPTFVSVTLKHSSLDYAISGTNINLQGIKIRIENISRNGFKIICLNNTFYGELVQAVIVG